MTHRHDMPDQEVEEVAEELWTLGEEGRVTVEVLRGRTQVRDVDRVLEMLGHRGMIRRDGPGIFLTPRGRELAERQVRRHRLAELLFSTVLEVDDDLAVDRTACVMEHILSPAVTDSVCSFLGHPKFCPHGKAIPPGPCCRSFSNSVEPLVQPLDRLGVGQAARIVYIVPNDPSRLVRLSNLGIVPGATIRLQQKKPAAVLAIGETTLALDPAIVTEIYVKSET